MAIRNSEFTPSNEPLREVGRDKWGRGKGCNSLQPRNYCTNYCANYCTDRRTCMIVARSATILAIVGAVVGAIVSRLQTIALSGPLAFSDSRILARGLGPETFKIRGRRAGFQQPSVYFGGVDDFSPGLEGRVGDQFWHPQGVQVKAPSS